MKELEQAGEGLEAGIVKDDLKEVLADLSNMPLQEVGENIPGLSVLFKGIKAIGSIRNYQLQIKAMEFLHEISTMPFEKRKSLVEKITSDTIYGQKFGSYLISAIDRHEFAQKSIYLARLCKYYERGDIFKTDLVKLNTMIDNLHLQDIIEWQKYHRIPKSEKDTAYNSFLANGVIMREYDFNLIGSDSKNNRSSLVNRQERIIKTRLTTLGSVLYSVVKDEDLDELTKRLLYNHEQSRTSEEEY